VDCRSCGFEQPAALELAAGASARAKPNGASPRSYAAASAHNSTLKRAGGALMPVGLADADYIGCILASYSFVV
jgi:hypothetical protein